MSAYQCKQSPIHGLGLFAKRDISAGEIILQEAPILTMPQEVLKDEGAEAKFIVDSYDLPDKVFSRVRAHCYAVHGGNISVLTKAALLARDATAMSLLVTTVVNSGISVVTASGEQRFLFDDITQLNHGCKPNAQCSWAEEKQLMAVKATTHIRQGSEILVSYLSDLTIPFLDKAGREEVLEVKNVVCQCDVCSLEGRLAEQAEGLMKSVQDQLRLFAAFRLKHFGEQQGIDVFAMNGNVPIMYGKAKDICNESAPLRNKLEESIGWLARNVDRLGFAHSSLALVDEVKYILHGAKALCSSVVVAQSSLQGGASDSNQSDVTLGSAQITHMVSTPDFLAALEAKLHQLEVLDTCVGMWHPRAVAVMKQLMGMWFTGGNNAPSHAIVKRLQAMGLTVKSHQDEDGRWSFAIGEPGKLEEALEKVSVAEWS